MLHFTRHMKQKALIITLLTGILILLFITRFYNLNWGLPYPMHPDERNMAVAVTTLTCDSLGSPECLHPHFFAYGQLPLYTAYAMVKAYHLSIGTPESAVSFEQATMALRYIAASASVITVFVMFVMLQFIIRKLWNTKARSLYSSWIIPLLSLIFIFVPGLIQFSHYGTTEALLMMFYTLLQYVSLRALSGKVPVWKYVLVSGIISGLAIGTKISALPFLAVPCITILLRYPFSSMFVGPLHKGWLRKEKATVSQRLGEVFSLQSIKKNLLHVVFIVGNGLLFFLVTAVATAVSSPYNLLAWQEFQGSMSYESAIGLGTYVAFYTRQFVDTTPVLFHISYILPFVFGLPIFLTFVIGLVILPWNKREINMLRVAFIFFFIPQVLLFAKWTRFLAPVFPVMTLITALTIYYLYHLSLKKWKSEFVSRALVIVFIFISILPGVGYFSMYTKEDVRFTASKWIFENIPENSFILSETANVIDLPLTPPDQPYVPRTYFYTSFDYYGIHENILLEQDFQTYLAEAQYLFVPSRRVFANHTCLQPQEFIYKSEPEALITFPQVIPLPDPIHPRAERCKKLQETYPQLNAFYEDLFSGKLGFEPVAEFTAEPDISLFGVRLIAFPDEYAEETWTVFDHPVIRIYKRK